MIFTIDDQLLSTSGTTCCIYIFIEISDRYNSYDTVQIRQAPSLYRAYLDYGNNKIIVSYKEIQSCLCTCRISSLFPRRDFSITYLQMCLTLQ